MNLERRKKIVYWGLIALAVLAFVGCSMLGGHRDGPSYGEYEGALCAKHGGQDC